MSDSNLPLFDMLIKYNERGRASFHTPGHKGRAGLISEIVSLEHDITELPDTASLYDGGDAIEQAEKLAASAFGASITLFSGGGCTLCIQTMLLLGAGGGRVVFARNSHRSAIHTAALLGIEPVWAWPTGKNGQVSYNDIKIAINKGNIRAVYITSPDYYGNLADIPSIAKLCRKAGVPLLVDNAHGSHLGAFGLHPLALGADMTADSSHKTLPVLTGGAMLHIRNSKIERQSAKAAMALFGSTSPSFPVLASLDLARDWWQRAGTQAYNLTAEAVKELADTALNNGVGVFSGDKHDPARLTLDTSALGVNGCNAASYFRDLGCEPEYSDAKYVVFIITPFNTPEELKQLKKAVEFLPIANRRGHLYNKNDKKIYSYDEEAPEIALSPRDALLAPCVTVNTDNACGLIAARAVCPCPPGIAAVVPGEIISKDTAKKLKLCGFDKLVIVKTN